MCRFPLIPGRSGTSVANQKRIMVTTSRPEPGGAAHPERGPTRPLAFVVDDDPSALELLRAVAQDAGWAVRGFTRLRDVQEALRGESPALIVLDDDLPDGRGGDLARELRCDARLRGVPLLVCTGAHAMRRAEIGAWAPVVSKPFDVVEMERLLADAAEAAPDSRHAVRAATDFERAG
jgi:DNA-binding response OmpR family regulator